MEKDHLSIQKVVKNQKNKQQNLKLWARVPIVSVFVLIHPIWAVELCELLALL